MTDLEREDGSGVQNHKEFLMGTDRYGLNMDLLERVTWASLPKKERDREGVLKVQSYFREIRPEDPISAMVYGQLYALNAHSMALMDSAQRNPMIDIREQYLRVANRLLRTFNTSLDTLGRFRRQGQQVIRVETVNVNDGGQAIVGGPFEKNQKG